MPRRRTTAKKPDESDQATHPTSSQVSDTGSAGGQVYGLATLLDGLRSQVALAMVAASCSLLLYINTINHEFVFDDHPAIMRNELLHRWKTDWGALFSVWTHDFWGQHIQSKSSHKSYRPLSVLSFFVDFLFSGMNPKSYHVTNVIINALCCVAVVYCVVPRLRTGSPKRRIPIPTRGKRSSSRGTWTVPISSALAVLVYVFHPVRTEAVNSVVGRSDVLSTLLGVLAFGQHRQAMHESGSSSIRSMFLCILLTVGAALAKEGGITVTVICAAHDFARYVLPFWAGKARGVVKAAQAKAAVWRIAALALVAVLYLGGRAVAFQGLSLPQASYIDNPLNFAEPSVKTLTALYIQSLYLWLLFFPYRLCVDYAFDVIPLVTSVTDPRIVMVGVAVLLVAFCVWRAVNDSVHRADPRLAVALAWWALPLLPASHVVPIGLVLAERLLYMPCLGFGLFVGYWADRVWGSPLSKSDSTAPAKPHTETGGSDAASTTSDTASVTSTRRGKRRSADKKSAKTQKRSSAMSNLVFVLAMAVLVAYSVRVVTRNPEWRTSRSIFSSAIRTYPRCLKARNEMASEHVSAEEWDEALNVLQGSVKMFKLPHTCQTVERLSVVYGGNSKHQDLEKALKYARQFVNCSQATSHLRGFSKYRLGVTLMRMDRITEAAKYMDETSKLPETRCFAGLTYGRAKMYKKSIIAFRKCELYTNTNRYETPFMQRPALVNGFAFSLFLGGKEYWEEAKPYYESAIRHQRAKGGSQQLHVLQHDLNKINAYLKTKRAK